MSANVPRSSFGGMDAEVFYAPREDTSPVAAIPKGIERETFTAIEPDLGELNLSPEQTSKLADAYATKVLPLVEKRARESAQSCGGEIRAEIARDLEADPHVGGKKLNQSRAFAARAIAHFIPDKAEREGLAKYLNATGFGNQRHLVRILAGAGRMLSDRKPATEADKFYGRK